MRALRNFRRRVKGSADSDDELRERRLDSVRCTVEEFAYDLALLTAGHDPAFERCASPAVADRLRSAVRPFLASGDAMRPDFGAYGELRVDGDLLDVTRPVAACIEFDDRSMRQTGDGRLLPAPRRRMRMALKVSLQPTTITACHVEALPTR